MSLEMNADDFARNCRREKDSLVDTYFDGSVETAVGTRIREMRLDTDHLSMLRSIMDGALTDAFYTLLLGLDGVASIGGIQQRFDLRDESGHQIAGGGELESAAFTQFQED